MKWSCVIVGDLPLKDRENFKQIVKNYIQEFLSANLIISNGKNPENFFIEISPLDVMNVTESEMENVLKINSVEGIKIQLQKYSISNSPDAKNTQTLDQFIVTSDVTIDSIHEYEERKKMINDNNLSLSNQKDALSLNCDDDDEGLITESDDEAEQEIVAKIMASQNQTFSKITNTNNTSLVSSPQTEIIDVTDEEFLTVSVWNYPIGNSYKVDKDSIFEDFGQFGTITHYKSLGIGEKRRIMLKYQDYKQAKKALTINNSQLRGNIINVYPEPKFYWFSKNSVENQKCYSRTTNTYKYDSYEQRAHSILTSSSYQSSRRFGSWVTRTLSVMKVSKCNPLERVQITLKKKFPKLINVYKGEDYETSYDIKCEFPRVEDAFQIYSHDRFILYNGKRHVVDFTDSLLSRYLWVGNLDVSSENDFKNHFKELENVEKILFNYEISQCIISCEDISNAEMLLSKLRGAVFKSKKLCVDYMNQASIKIFILKTVRSRKIKETLQYWDIDTKSDNGETEDHENGSVSLPTVLKDPKSHISSTYLLDDELRSHPSDLSEKSELSFEHHKVHVSNYMKSFPSNNEVNFINRRKRSYSSRSFSSSSSEGKKYIHIKRYNDSSNRYSRNSSSSSLDYERNKYGNRYSRTRDNNKKYLQVSRRSTSKKPANNTLFIKKSLYNNKNNNTSSSDDHSYSCDQRPSTKSVSRSSSTSKEIVHKTEPKMPNKIKSRISCHFDDKVCIKNLENTPIRNENSQFIENVSNIFANVSTDNKNILQYTKSNIHNGDNSDTRACDQQCTSIERKIDVDKIIHDVIKPKNTVEVSDFKATELLNTYFVLLNAHVTLKQDTVPIQMHYIYGNSLFVSKINSHFNDHTTSVMPTINIRNRISLDTLVLDKFEAAINNGNNCCIALVLPIACSNKIDIYANGILLKNTIISYLIERNVAGIADVEHSDIFTCNDDAKKLFNENNFYLLPPSNFSNSIISRFAPSLSPFIEHPYLLAFIGDNIL